MKFTLSNSNFLFLLFAIFLSGCTSYVEMPNLNLEEKNPPKPEEISTLSFALAEPEIIVKTAMTQTTTSGLTDRVKQDSKSVACYLYDEINKILLSKGFTITDHFQSYNHMTFTQKRNTSALFYPEIVINVEEKSQLERTRVLFIKSDTIKGRMQIDASVNIVMLEPLSGEKIWVKSLPINDIDELVAYKPGLYGGAQLNGFFVPEDLKPIADIIDDLFEEISMNVVNATENYVEKYEFEFLDEDIRRLKGIKRY